MPGTILRASCVFTVSFHSNPMKQVLLYDKVKTLGKRIFLLLFYVVVVDIWKYPRYFFLHYIISSLCYTLSPSPWPFLKISIQFPYSFKPLLGRLEAELIGWSYCGAPRRTVVNTSSTCHMALSSLVLPPWIFCNTVNFPEANDNILLILFLLITIMPGIW